ncbi:MAG TPA: hypothetical protein DDY78_11940 [Planctomycetales bacterium]|jgi:hypothetical protein|nr:hypothetical protein [Planctomycetales bacterium]
MQTVRANVEDWIAAYSEEPDKVREFCVRHGILDYVHTAIELAQSSFPPIEKLTLSLWTDPLEGTEKVRIFLEVRSGFDEAMAADWQFLLQWTQTAPLPERYLISFSYITV